MGDNVASSTTPTTAASARWRRNPDAVEVEYLERAERAFRCAGHQPCNFEWSHTRADSTWMLLHRPEQQVPTGRSASVTFRTAFGQPDHFLFPKLLETVEQFVAQCSHVLMQRECKSEDELPRYCDVAVLAMLHVVRGERGDGSDGEGGGTGKSKGKGRACNAEPQACMHTNVMLTPHSVDCEGRSDEEVATLAREIIAPVIKWFEEDRHHVPLFDSVPVDLEEEDESG